MLAIDRLWHERKEGEGTRRLLPMDILARGIDDGLQMAVVRCPDRPRTACPHTSSGGSPLDPGWIRDARRLAGALQWT